MLVPRPVVNDDQVAGLPVVTNLVDDAVAVTGDHVQPRLAAVAVARLVEPRGQLVHDRGQPGRVVADGLVDHEQAACTTLGDQALDVVEAGDQPGALASLPLAGQALGASRVRVRALERDDLRRTRRKLGDRRVTAVLQQRRAELLQHRLDAPGVEYRGLLALVAVAVPRPGRQVERVPRAPVDTLAVDLGPAGAGLDEHDGVPAVAMDRGGHARGDLMDRGVEVLGRPIAVPARVYAAAETAMRVVVHRHVGALENRLVIRAPFLEQRLPALLLDLVVRDLGLRRRLHRDS